MERFFDILEGIAIFILLAAAAFDIILLVYVCVDAFITKDNYSYVMDDGTSGTADCCSSGRGGGLYCTKDGRTFTVKEFSKK